MKTTKPLGCMKTTLFITAFAVSETLWAIATNVVANLVPFLTHQEGAPVDG